jgi:hypothetical protein
MIGGRLGFLGLAPGRSRGGGGLVSPWRFL